MKKHELLKKAYDEYPKGTIFKNMATQKQVESCGNFTFSKTTSAHIWIYDTMASDLVYNDMTGKWAEIVKPKIAVLVTTEKEVNAICKFKAWSYPVTAWLGKCDCVVYLDGPFLEYNKLSEHNEQDLENYKLIPFDEFAEEHRIKLPLITSEDGFDLYIGSKYFTVRIFDLKYSKDTPYLLSDEDEIIYHPDQYKAFSTKQAALSWIEAQKPKTYELDCGIISDKGLAIRNGLTFLNKVEIEVIAKYIQELNQK